MCLGVMRKKHEALSLIFALSLKSSADSNGQSDAFPDISTEAGLPLVESHYFCDKSETVTAREMAQTVHWDRPHLKGACDHMVLQPSTANPGLRLPGHWGAVLAQSVESHCLRK